MIVQHFFDPRTYTLTYVVADEATKIALVIDPVLDYDPKAGKTFTESAEAVAAWIDARGYQVPYVLDTHVHADHLTAIPFFKQRYGAKSVIGEDVTTVQDVFKGLLNLGDEFKTDGSQFDVRMGPDDVLKAGPFEVRAIPTGGHTPASVSYLIGDAVFVGDSLFQPDAGTARCDFPGGSAAELYDSVMRIYALPDATRVFTLHDYQPGGRKLEFESTVGRQKRENVHLKATTTKEEFVALRAELERGKEAPTLLLPSVQVNMRAGELPPPESNGVRYLKIPLNAFHTAHE
ncbi:MAG: MBL fold metallo-hydrolase [Planctomycetes bacterium]|nr:MBL fold metallo-hydrolase [Planctomycetota bacterium]